MKTNVSLLICLVSMLLLSCKNERKEQFIAEIPRHTNLISYRIAVDYDNDIDSVSSKDLTFFYSKDSVITSFKIEEWKK
jgi:CO/xanthine dehydrogenase Mo-binding subunit